MWRRLWLGFSRHRLVLSYCFTLQTITDPAKVTSETVFTPHLSSDVQDDTFYTKPWYSAAQWLPSHTDRLASVSLTPPLPPALYLPSANMHNASFIVQLKVYSIPNTMICILPTGIVPEYPEFFSRASHAFFRWTDRIQTALAERLLLVCVCSCLCVCVFLGKEHGVYVCVAGRLVLI